MKRLALLMFLMCSTAVLATVTTQTYTVAYTCSGGFGPFAFTFPISDPTALTVTMNSVLLSPSDYTTVAVNNNYNNGGSVTLSGSFPCTAGWPLVLARVTPVTQSVKFYDNMPIPMSTFERGLDKLTEIEQEIYGSMGLTLASPPSIGNVTPNTGAFTTLSATGLFTSTVVTGSAPFSVASATNVPNLNASYLLGGTWASPGTIGAGTPVNAFFTGVSSLINPFISGYQGRTVNNPWTITRGTRLAPITNQNPNIFAQIVGSIGATPSVLPSAIVGQAIANGTGNTANVIGVTGEAFTESAATAGNSVGGVGILGFTTQEVDNGYGWGGWFICSDNNHPTKGCAGVEIDLNDSYAGRTLGQQAGLTLVDASTNNHPVDTAMQWTGSWGYGIRIPDASAMVAGIDFGSATFSDAAMKGNPAGSALKNFTFTGASNGNNLTLLNAQSILPAITGTGSAATVFTYSLPANTIANLKGIHLRVGWNHTGSASVAYILSLNGQTVGSFASTAVNNNLDEVILAVSSSTAVTSGAFVNNSASVPVVNSVGSLAWGSNQTLLLTFNVANTDTVTPVLWTVEVMQ